MSSQRTNFASWDEEQAHRQKVIRKLEKIQGLEALLEMWEKQPDAHEYILELRRKLRSAQNQYRAMKP